jgi:PAS domain S-box-containing protein
MGHSISLLVVEDIPDDAELMILALQRDGLDVTWERVETADELKAALASRVWDAVLSDYTLPEFGAIAALKVVREADPDMPFLVVSGTVGEEVAVGMMRVGANDYVLKHNLIRLAAAIKREVREAGNRRASRRAEQGISRLAAIVDSSDDAIISKTLTGIVTSWNPGAERLHGWTAEEAIGRHISFIVPPDKADEFVGVMERLRRGEHFEHFETVRLHKDGTRHDVSITASPIRNRDGVLDGVSKVARDISERKRAEEQVRASLREKEVLLKEIHHRVKNNLQIVSTLLDLQSGYTMDSAAIEMFQQSRGRVKSMALIHKRLYHEQDMARVDFAEYIQQLTDDLFRSYKMSDDIRLEVDVDIPPLTIDIAIPCGLLLNELLSNCFKHAFVGTTDGHLRVTLHQHDGASVLTISDDGPGFPAGTDFRNTLSFGLQLVNTLVDQLNGEICMTSDGGTTFIVRFPKTTL